MPRPSAPRPCSPARRYSLRPDALRSCARACQGPCLPLSPSARYARPRRHWHGPCQALTSPDPAVLARTPRHPGVGGHNLKPLIPPQPPPGVDCACGNPSGRPWLGRRVAALLTPPGCLRIRTPLRSALMLRPRSPFGAAQRHGLLARVPPRGFVAVTGRIARHVEPCSIPPLPPPGGLWPPCLSSSGAPHTFGWPSGCQARPRTFSAPI